MAVRWDVRRAASLMVPSFAAFAVAGCGFDSRPRLGWQDDSITHLGDAGGSTIPAPEAVGGDAVPRDSGVDQGAVQPDPRPSSSLPVAGSDSASAAGAGVSTPMSEPRAAADSDAGAPPDAGETSTAAPLACPTGSYVGDFACTLNVSTWMLTTQIAFSLETKSPHATTATTTSSVSFTYEGAVFFADLQGRLECEAGRFHADVVDGVVGVALVPFTGPFSGSIDGQLDRRAGILGGTWTLDSLGGPTCTGEWKAPLRP